jgi:hypothetical protein
MDLQKKLIVLAAPAALATALVLTPANDAEAALYHFDLQSQFTYLDSSVNDISIGDVMQISGVIDTEGLYDGIASSSRLGIEIPNTNLIDVNFTLNGLEYAVGEMLVFARTSRYSVFDNSLYFYTMQGENISLGDDEYSRIECFDPVTITSEEAASVEDGLDAAFNNCSTFYFGGVHGPDALAETISFNSYYESEATPSSNVSAPATLALFGLGFAGLGITKRRRAAEFVAV